MCIRDRGPLALSALQSMFWFFTYRFTLAPILAVAPVFALLGALVPLAVYRSISKHLSLIHIFHGKRRLPGWG